MGPWVYKGCKRGGPRISRDHATTPKFLCSGFPSPRSNIRKGINRFSVLSLLAMGKSPDITHSGNQGLEVRLGQALGLGFFSPKPEAPKP